MLVDRNLLKAELDIQKQKAKRADEALRSMEMEHELATAKASEAKTQQAVVVEHISC